MDVNVEKVYVVTKISRELSPVKIMIDQGQQEDE
jgi:hypothetical protein